MKNISMNFHALSAKTEIALSLFKTLITNLHQHFAQAQKTFHRFSQCLKSICTPYGQLAINQ